MLTPARSGCRYSPYMVQQTAASLLRHIPFCSINRSGARAPWRPCRTPQHRGRIAACETADASVTATKSELFEEIKGTDRGIFGVPAEKRRQILALIEQIETASPPDNITAHLDRVAGDWRLLFSTISITGKRRTKLGLRQFITLGNFRQSIDLKKHLAVNAVDFDVTGFGFLHGTLRIEASYRVAGPQRVDIDFESATLEPSQFQALFEQNFDLLLSIFNPAGWLDITFVDDEHRIGRDDKGNVFLLERM